MTNADALKALYTALGGSADLTTAVTVAEVLNAIAVLFGGSSDAIQTADAIQAITAVASAIVPTKEQA